MITSSKRDDASRKTTTERVALGDVKTPATRKTNGALPNGRPQQRKASDDAPLKESNGFVIMLAIFFILGFLAIAAVAYMAFTPSVSVPVLP